MPGGYLGILYFTHVDCVCSVIDVGRRAFCCFCFPTGIKEGPGDVMFVPRKRRGKEGKEEEVVVVVVVEEEEGTIVHCVFRFATEFQLVLPGTCSGRRDSRVRKLLPAPRRGN